MRNAPARQTLPSAPSGSFPTRTISGVRPKIAVREAETECIVAGAMVTPNVRLVHPLARGGMGSVWLAEHLGLQTQVAVKFMASELAKEHCELAQRFSREAAISARIRSVHAVQVFDHGCMPDGTPYIVMELLEGCALDEWLAVRGCLELSEVAAIVAQVAKLLHRAHTVGVVHRDIKPENVFMVDSDYELFVKILDFGIAKQSIGTRRHAEVTATGVAVGTPGYIAPEQALNAKEADHRSDLWALGVLAYELLTGQLPYGVGEESEPWWLRLMHGEFTPVTFFGPELPLELDQWFARALHPKAEQRFQTAREMAEAFTAIAASHRPSLNGIIDEPSVDWCVPVSPAERAAVLEVDGDAGPIGVLEPADEVEAPPSTVPGQYDWFTEDEATDDGTLIMDPADLQDAAARDSQPPARAALASLAPTGDGATLGGALASSMPPAAGIAAWRRAAGRRTAVAVLGTVTLLALALLATLVLI